jgi:hypothetical protein
MGWTAPKTWIVGETLTAANFNTHIRDNLLSVGEHLIARKPSDESVASSTTLQDDDTLTLTVGANEVWQMFYLLRVSAVSATVGIKIGWTFPTSGEISFSSYGINTAGAQINWFIQSSSSPYTGISLGVSLTGSQTNMMPITGLYVGAGSAGTVQLQWAQASSNGSATIVKQHSTLWAVKLA